MSEAPEVPVVEATPPVTPAAEAPAVVATPAVGGSWRDTLPVDMRDDQTLSQIPDIEALAREHINVQKVIGADKIARPQEDWTPEQFDEFYTKLGRPAKVEDYDLAGVEAPEGLPVIEGFQESMVGEMHKLGLSSTQVAGILKSYYEGQGAQFEAAGVDRQQASEAGIQDLRNEWGKSFDAQVDLANRALRAGAGDQFEALSQIELSDGSLLGNNPAIIKVFAALGGKMSEHGLVGAAASRSTVSPSEAGAQIAKLKGDPEFLKSFLHAEHPEHAASVKRIDDLTIAQVGTAG